jgi:tRNA threonylcarbamoyladenosine biosynthesis protein TsaB
VSLIQSRFILGIETCSRRGGVSLFAGRELVGRRQADDQTSLSLTLLKMIDDVLRDARIGLDDMSLFGVAAGPGSFTGLRIGMATIKSFSASLGIPCVGVPTLHATAFAAGPSPRTLALMPAGRGEVFAQILSVGTDGGIQELSRAVHLAPDALLNSIRTYDALRISGEGVQLYLDLFNEKAAEFSLTARTVDTGEPIDSLDEGWTLIAGGEPLSDAVALVALQHYDSNNMSEPGLLDPIYVRPSDPELKLICPETNTL